MPESMPAAQFWVPNSQHWKSPSFWERKRPSGAPEYDWAEYKLTKGKIGRILNDFGIKSQSAVWLPEGKHRNQQSAKRGYVRAGFEMAWARYCPIKTGAVISF
jgi:hypothetical protein